MLYDDDDDNDDDDDVVYCWSHDSFTFAFKNLSYFLYYSSTFAGLEKNARAFIFFAIYIGSHSYY